MFIFSISSLKLTNDMVPLEDCTDSLAGDGGTVGSRLVQHLDVSERADVLRLFLPRKCQQAPG